MIEFFEITPEDVKQFWEEKVSKPCSLCEHDDFEAYTPTDNSIYLLVQNAKRISESGLLAAEGGGLLAIPVICSNCGNITFLARHKIAAWKKEKDKNNEESQA